MVIIEKNLVTFRLNNLKIYKERSFCAGGSGVRFDGAVESAYNEFYWKEK